MDEWTSFLYFGCQDPTDEETVEQEPCKECELWECECDC